MLRPVLLAAAVVLTAVPHARALESAPVRSERVTATLVSDADAAQPGVPLRLGLRLRLAPGWHTYWRNPGDAGAPPELELRLPDGATAGPIAWPAPQRLPEGPVMTYGYTGEMLLPVTVQPAPSGGPLHIEASATWLVCERICVPEEGSFRLDLPAGTHQPSAEASLFAAADARTPRALPFEARSAPDGTLAVTGAELNRATVRDAWFLPAEWGVVEHAVPQALRVVDGGLRLALKPGAQWAGAAVLRGVLAIRDGSGQEAYYDLEAPRGAVPDVAGPAATTGIAAGGDGLPKLILFALLGGLLLNGMPCVFPVLAMKAVSFAKLSGVARGAVRLGALSYVAGVLAAFAALGGALLLARQAGSAAGWGFQFQSPVFVATMAWLLFGTGLNLSGVFQAGAGLAGAGQGWASRRGHWGSFATGLLAVVVATPCTAPFMGAAIAGALAAPPAATIAVFLAMGLGLAAPYALLAAFPGLAGALPRPGPWMDTLKGALAFPMYAAAAWLVWVLSLQAGPGGVLAAGAGMVALGFAAWLLGLAQRADGRWRRAGYAGALAAALASLALLPGLHGAVPASAQDAQAASETARDEGTEPFSPTRLAALRAEGRPVFVNMTAAWCVTCLVNERIALRPEAVRRAFRDRQVAYLKGDWTRGDPAVTGFLREHARDGVPLYVFYPPGGQPQVLPQILTERTILDQLDRVRTNGG